MEMVMTQPMLEAKGEQLPVRKGFFKEVFGQFLTAAFWKELAKTIVHEALIAFIMALGGALTWYGGKKANPETQGVRTYGMAAAKPVSPTTSAFSQGFSPTPEFTRPSYPLPTSHDNAMFPGFGGGR